MGLTPEDVAQIVRLLEDSSFQELDIEVNGLKLFIRRGGTAQAAPGPQTKVIAAQGENAVVADICSPARGVFYRASAPGQRPFVEVGASVEPTTVVGIVEVMKVLSPVEAEVSGEIVDICVENNQEVAEGQPLFRVKVQA